MKQKWFWRVLLCGLLCVGALLQPLTQTVQATSTKKTINWRKPSQQKAYPNLKKHPQVWIDVSQKKQRVYIKDGKKVLYTMYASTGKDHSTPNGTFHIQKERGKFFYNQQSGEGAKYWTSWKDHGVYLFHSVPTDQEGHFLKKEADQLGKEANSHGCVRLTVPDAKWINENMPVGTKVVIHQ